MLHMIVNTHDAGDCAFRGEEERALLAGAVEALAAPGAVDGFEVRGSWVHRTGHEIFMLVDAPSAHVIETAMLARVREQWGVSSEQLASSYPAKRTGTAAEVAEVVLWLASNEASYVSGQVVGIDGGGLP